MFLFVGAEIFILLGLFFAQPETKTKLMETLMYCTEQSSREYCRKCCGSEKGLKGVRLLLLTEF